jgi:hypothetical protein
MTAETTFKEYVEEKGLTFSLLDFGSPEYVDLVEAFNKVKFRLEAEEEARECGELRARLKLHEQSEREQRPIRPHLRRLRARVRSVAA